MIFPHHAPRSRKSRVYPLYRRIMLEIGARADAIIADSEVSRNDVIKHLLIPAEDADKVKAIHLGVSDRFRQARSAPEHSKETPDRPRRILYVGRADPYKNVSVLIQAFSAARKRCPFPVALTMAGQPDPRYPEAVQLVRQLGLADAVTWAGYLSDAKLAAAYASADLLVHPSRYEGFGLQVAEAMACGVPVVCSDGGSLPEVAGDAAILLKPDDVAGFGDEIVRVLSTPSLAADLSARGMAQAARFTWRRTAEETLALYSLVTGQSVM
jgi:glycosyltransferase involved in cell wall biosynthesis